ncbi:hypothetical protein DTO217A2_4873 [Paecilomyces variotii]|nr:hypothetical protein DTO217A2_4873 [Paecilomyces variotii]
MDHPALTRATASAHSIMASISSSTAAPLAAMATPFPPGSPYAPGDDDTGECKLLGPFSLLVQAALGALALLSLVYKRYRERPQRPVKIWAFDASKQVFGSAMLHLANLLMSMFSAGKFEITARKYQPNPCSFYLLNLGIDTTLGIPILIFILRILNALAMYTPLANPPESIESGNYGDPPRASWWFKQSIIYFVGLLGMKICVFFIIDLMPWIVSVGDWALRWTEGNTAIQICFVMLLFPVIMNALQYYIIDTFIKKQTSVQLDSISGDEEIDSEFDPNDRHHRSALLAGLDDSDSDSDDDSVLKEPESPSQPHDMAHHLRHVEYDPRTDGENRSQLHSSGSGSSSHGEYGQDPFATKLTSRPVH